MREKLVEYVTLLFAGTADSQDMRQEILQNTLDRYDDLIAQGKSPEAAYRLAIATIGDVQEILEEDPDKTNMPTKSKKHFSWAIPLSILLLLVYLGTFMLMFFLPKNDETKPTDPLLYTITCADRFSAEALLDDLEQGYRPGQSVTLKTHIFHDTDLELYVNGIFACKQTPVKTGESYSHWEFTFTMPESNVTISFQTSQKPGPSEAELNQQKYLEAVALAAAGKKGEAAIAFARLGDFMDAKDRCLALWSEISSYTTVTAHNALLIGIRSDGTVITHSHLENSFPEIESWTNLRSLATGMKHIVGLRSDGTVVATGDNTYGQCNVSTWTDIISVDCGFWFTVGLKKDGTLVFAGSTDNSIDESKNWTGIVMVEAAGYNLIALRADGTALSVGKGENKLYYVPEWDDIIDIYLDHERAIYLRADGTLCITGNALYIENQQISGLQTVESDGVYLAGKMLDGTMYFEGYNYPHDINDKGDIVAIIDYAMGKLALCSDGSLVLLFKYSASNAEHPEWGDLMCP